MKITVFDEYTLKKDIEIVVRYLTGQLINVVNR
jgi:hypothetical protein